MRRDCGTRVDLPGGLLLAQRLYRDLADGRRRVLALAIWAPRAASTYMKWYGEQRQSMGTISCFGCLTSQM